MHAFSILLNLEELWLRIDVERLSNAFPSTFWIENFHKEFQTFYLSFTLLRCPVLPIFVNRFHGKYGWHFVRRKQDFFDLFQSSREYHSRWSTSYLDRKCNHAISIYPAEQNHWKYSTNQQRSPTSPEESLPSVFFLDKLSSTEFPTPGFV